MFTHYSDLFLMCLVLIGVAYVGVKFKNYIKRNIKENEEAEKTFYFHHRNKIDRMLNWLEFVQQNHNQLDSREVLTYNEIGSWLHLSLTLTDVRYIDRCAAKMESMQVNLNNRGLVWVDPLLIKQPSTDS